MKLFNRSSSITPASSDNTAGSAPATFDQAKQLLALLAHSTIEQVQQIFTNGDLLQCLIEASDLKNVDRDAFRRLLGLTPLTELMRQAPANLQEILLRQVEKYIAIGAHHELMIKVTQYRTELKAAVDRFEWSTHLAAIGLNRATLIDYRLSDEFLAKVAGVDHLFDIYGIGYRGHGDIVTPKCPTVVQAQWGTKPKYRDQFAGWCLDTLDMPERGATVKEGLTAVVIEGQLLIKDGTVLNLPGSTAVSKDNNGTPAIFRSMFGRIVLNTPRTDDIESRGHTSATVARF